MIAPYRKPGEVLPDRPLPPAVTLPRPPGKRMWINMLQGRRRLGPKPLWARIGLVEVLVGIAALAVLAAIVSFSLTADLGVSDSARNPNFCSCPCDD